MTRISRTVMRQWGAVGVTLLLAVFLVSNRAVNAATDHRPASEYAPIAGSWWVHGGSLVVQANGSGTESFRMYILCTGDRVTACDKVIKNTIYGGGYIRFKLTSAAGSRYSGKVTESVYSWQIGTSITIVRHANGTLAIQALAGLSRACRQGQNPGSYCGA